MTFVIFRGKGIKIKISSFQKLCLKYILSYSEILSHLRVWDTLIFGFFLGIFGGIPPYLVMTNVIFFKFF